VIGGDIEVTAGAQLQAPSGRVNMASVASAGEVRLEPNGLGIDSFNRLGRIEMNQESIIDTSGEGGGNIFIRSGQFTMDHSRVQSQTQGGKNGEIVSVKTGDFQMRNEAQISTSTVGLGRAGDVWVEAEDLEIHQASILTSTEGFGRGGDVWVEADHVLLDGGGALCRHLCGDVGR
jgi:hypothetical protein